MNSHHLKCLSAVAAGLLLAVTANAQQTPAASQTPPRRGNPADTEEWEPVPKVVLPGKTFSDAPSDALILFDGKNMDQWVTTKDKSAVKWDIAKGVLTVNKATGGGNIETKQAFKNYQLHLEWKVPANVTGEGQGRGNSGLFLASTGGGDAGYEVQIMDSYNNENKTYVNGMAGAVYKQFIPLANPARKNGEWNVYDVAWTAPTFNEDGTLKTAAHVTVFFNGVLVQNNVELLGETLYIGKPVYKKYDTAPIKLQAHGDKSEPVSFRNIWIRGL
ncbi:3-keto-disaccharide hydrolase [Hufsiella ginkgonis]|uniref:DUF1080 domain-containing protein n=1 Tax=Hufsiella ginkgonis TaxID=2695274 RepID=A0A7K1Y2M9_9SPHI|nr:DUF1080 domain-containing protein [Hufsiella ginkgonis]MXV17269.1 DUF1080 domain-containing protein [Hufsiella ginkgonis]